MILSEVIEKVKSLGLPQDSYVIFGSGPMALAGIREVNDIDMYVTLDVWNQIDIKLIDEYFRTEEL